MAAILPVFPNECLVGDDCEESRRHGHVRTFSDQPVEKVVVYAMPSTRSACTFSNARSADTYPDEGSAVLPTPAIDFSIAMADFVIFLTCVQKVLRLEDVLQAAASRCACGGFCDFFERVEFLQQPPVISHVSLIGTGTAKPFRLSARFLKN